MKIRRAENRDSQTIALFIRATLQDMASVGGHAVNPDDSFWQQYPEALSKFVGLDDRLCLLAHNDGAALGFLAGEIVKLPDVFIPKKSFHMNAVYVIPESRKQGIATSLVQEALQWAVGRGCQEADLNVLFQNNKAKALYKKFGFEVFQYEMRMKIAMNA